MLKVYFFGATDTVTGSRFLLDNGSHRVLVDCGLFQGVKNLRLRNREPFPFPIKDIDAVVLTHAHIDHSGYTPVLTKLGYQNKIYCTHATKDLLKIMLPDSGYLQEEEAKYLNKHKLSKHQPALPLYTVEDAENSLKHLEGVDWFTEKEILPGFTISFLPAGHILGASSVKIKHDGQTLLFSGDIGRQNGLIMKAPHKVSDHIDYLFVESTYGNRLHEKITADDELALIINDTYKRKGTVLIPSFAVGRAQSILYIINKLKHENRIPDLPVYLDSPMAVNASKIFVKNKDDLKLTEEEIKMTFTNVHYVSDTEHSKRLNFDDEPKVIISASGMITGGRILHHMKSRAPKKNNSIVIVGYQAMGTRGDSLVRGNKTLKIHGEQVPIQAHLYFLNNLSAHGDYEEILTWLKQFPNAPKKTFIVHGEPIASDTMRQHIENELHWNCHMPYYQEIVRL